VDIGGSNVQGSTDISVLELAGPSFGFLFASVVDMCNCLFHAALD
jgi:hypothetical protein